MHLPDGYLNASCTLATSTIAAGALTYAAVRLSREPERRSLTAFASLSAGIFAAQMLNYPVAAGTSGHVLGGALAGMLLGPWAGMLSVALVLAVQSLVFGDGGTSALGANILNMAVIGPLVGSGAMVLAERLRLSIGGRVALAGAAAWCSVMVAAVLCAIELAVSGTSALAQALPAMVSVHAVIGLGEALFTGAILLAVERFAGRVTQPAHAVNKSRSALWAACGGALLAPLAASSPDGLERVAGTLGFAAQSRASAVSMLADYALPGIASPALAVVLAGLAGLLVVYAFGLAFERALVRRAT